MSKKYKKSGVIMNLGKADLMDEVSKLRPTLRFDDQSYTLGVVSRLRRNEAFFRYLL